MAFESLGHRARFSNTRGKPPGGQGRPPSENEGRLRLHGSDERPISSIPEKSSKTETVKGGSKSPLGASGINRESKFRVGRPIPWTRRARRNRKTRAEHANAVHDSTQRNRKRTRREGRDATCSGHGRPRGDARSRRHRVGPARGIHAGTRRPGDPSGRPRGLRHERDAQGARLVRAPATTRG